MEAKERTTMKFSSRDAKCTGTVINLKKDPDTGRASGSEIESVELTLLIPAKDISVFEQVMDSLAEFELIEGRTKSP